MSSHIWLVCFILILCLFKHFFQNAVYAFFFRIRKRGGLAHFLNWKNQCFFQEYGERRISMGMISNRPRSMFRVSKAWEKRE